jgi:hypothetical protein
LAKTYTVSVVGESNYQRAITKKLEGTSVDLVHETENRFDDRAIRVDNHRGQTIGYIARGSWLASVIIDEGKSVTAEVASVEREPESGNYGVSLDVTIGAPKSASTSGHDAEAFADKVGKVAWGCAAIITIVLALAMFAAIS